MTIQHFLCLLVVLAILMSVHCSIPISVTVSVRGKKFNVKASTVKDVMEQVESLAGLEPDSQHVLFRGKILSGDNDLSDAGVSSGDVLNVVKRKISTSPSESTVQSNVQSNAQTNFQSRSQSDPNPSGSGLDNDPMSFKSLDFLNSKEFLESFYASDEKIEEARQHMLSNLQTYEKSIPGFSDMAKDIIYDKEKWRESMLRTREYLMKSNVFQRTSSSNPSR